MSMRDIIAGHLKGARYALAHSACFGQTLDLNLRHPGQPNGCAARIRISVDPYRVVCRVLNTGDQHKAFCEAAGSLLEFATTQMQGWEARSSSSGSAGGRVFWVGRSYMPSQLGRNILYTDLLQAVSRARTACAQQRKFRHDGKDTWQSSYMDDGAYQVEWRVTAQGSYVTVDIKNRGKDSDAFRSLTDWTFRHIKRHNPDCTDTNSGGPRGIGIGHYIRSDTMRLEVPSRPTF